MIPFALLALHVSAPAVVSSPVKPESKAHYDARMKWWKEARFGMFIHWGLYSIPAGKWGGKSDYAEWIREEAHIPVKEYEKFQPQFNPVKFDAKKWAWMAKDAGMKYVVLTTKHHDGFNMFFSHYTDWSIEHTPFHRDVARELANAVRGAGLHMGFYHSIMDWHHPDYLPRRSWEVQDRPADGADFDRFVKYLRNDVSQLLTEYGPIGVMWFDGEWENTWNAKYGDALYALCLEKQPNVIVNNRVSVGRGGIVDATKLAGDYGTPEQTIPATGLGDQAWETCMTMNGHWGYNAADTDWKSTKTLIHNLADIASKGGNYLLNIGPRSDGTFPPEAVQRLHEIGQWMHVNGESIYDTTASVFPGLTWGRSTTKREGDRTALYLTVFDWPQNGKLVVPGLGNAPLSARVLGGHRCAVSRAGSDVIVTVPASAPNSIASVVKLEVAGAPVVYSAPTIAAPSDLIVGAAKVVLRLSSNASDRAIIRYTLDGTTPTVDSPVYAGPITLSRTTTVTASEFLGSRRVSASVQKTFRTVAPWPATSAQPTTALTVDTWHEKLAKLPDDFVARPADPSEATAPDFAVPTKEGKAEEFVSQRYTADIRLPKDAVYTFVLGSDDGSKLWIDGQLVVDNDGLHSAENKAGSAPLAAGCHHVVVGWFNGSGSAALSVSLGAAGAPQKSLSAYLAR